MVNYRRNHVPGGTLCFTVTLAEVATLMDAEPGTPEGDRLDVLVTLVEAYEAKHWWIDPPDPIEAIKLRMQQRS